MHRTRQEPREGVKRRLLLGKTIDSLVQRDLHPFFLKLCERTQSFVVRTASKQTTGDLSLSSLRVQLLGIWDD